MEFVLAQQKDLTDLLVTDIPARALQQDTPVRRHRLYLVCRALSFLDRAAIIAWLESCAGLSQTERDAGSGRSKRHARLELHDVPCAYFCCYVGWGFSPDIYPIALPHPSAAQPTVFGSTDSLPVDLWGRILHIDAYIGSQDDYDSEAEADTVRAELPHATVKELARLIQVPPCWA